MPEDGLSDLPGFLAESQRRLESLRLPDTLALPEYNRFVALPVRDAVESFLGQDLPRLQLPFADLDLPALNVQLPAGFGAPPATFAYSYIPQDFAFFDGLPAYTGPLGPAIDWSKIGGNWSGQVPAFELPDVSLPRLSPINWESFKPPTIVVPEFDFNW
jgi:hypothetical protein